MVSFRSRLKQHTEFSCGLIRICRVRPFGWDTPRISLTPPRANQPIPRIEIVLETTFDPDQETTRVEHLEETFLTMLHVAHSNLGNQLKEHGMSANVELKPEGALDLRIKSLKLCLTRTLDYTSYLVFVIGHGRNRAREVLSRMPTARKLPGNRSS